jgi:hypothetical protein
VAVTENNELPLKATLFNKNHEQISLDSATITKDSITIKYLSGTLKTNTPSISITCDGHECHFTIPANMFGIIEVTLNGVKIGGEESGRYVNLTTYYSVPLAVGDVGQYVAILPTSIIYNNQGAEPKYY